MIESQYTPGPWKVKLQGDICGHNEVWAITDSNGILIAEVIPTIFRTKYSPKKHNEGPKTLNEYEKMCQKEGAANAHLLNKAYLIPEMIEALEVGLSAITHARSRLQIDYLGTITLIRSILAKAKDI